MLAVLLAGISFSGYAAVVTNWIADAGFEESTLWSYPNADTTPWLAAGEGANDAGWASRELAIVHSGSQALKYSTWGNAQALQDLPLTVDSNTVYELRFAMRLDTKSTNAAHTNDTDIAVILSTSPTLGGTYTWSGKSIYEQKPSTTGVWENITLIIDGSDPLLADNHGEYLRLGLKKWNKSSEYVAYVDDVQFGVYTNSPEPAPEGVLIAWDGSWSGSTSAAYLASGISGSIIPTPYFGVETTKGSTDGTFGFSVGGASTEASAFSVSTYQGNRAWIDFTVENNSGSDQQLNAVAFDWAIYWASGPESISLYYLNGDLNAADDTLINSATNLPVNQGGIADFDDYEWSLDGLADRILADGESATFRLSVPVNGTYAGGGFDNIAILGEDYAGTGYNAWAVEHSLIGGALGDDDSDGINNLTEYALNGNPTNSTVIGALPVLGAMASDGGTNWIEYVYLKRVSADNGLTYSLVQSQNLVLGSWTNNGDIVEVGESAAVGDFKTVTNRVPTDGKTQEFIQLQIEQN
jgi:hypothetical protein